MRITVDNGEPDLPVSSTTVYKPITDSKRFMSFTMPHQDVYRENLCQSFVSAKSSRILQKSAAKSKEGLHARSGSHANLGMRRKQGGGLFAQRVPMKPCHVIDAL